LKKTEERLEGEVQRRIFFKRDVFVPRTWSGGYDRML